MPNLFFVHAYTQSIPLLISQHYQTKWLKKNLIYLENEKMIMPL